MSTMLLNEAFEIMKEGARLEEEKRKEELRNLYHQKQKEEEKKKAEWDKLWNKVIEKQENEKRFQCENEIRQAKEKVNNEINEKYYGKEYTLKNAYSLMCDDLKNC